LLAAIFEPLRRPLRRQRTIDEVSYDRDRPTLVGSSQRDRARPSNA
jgi:hypothetical protein